MRFGIAGPATVLAAVLWFGCGCCPSSQPEGKSPFDGARCFRDLERVVGFGPRPSGSPELDALRDWLRSQLKAAGLEVWEHAFNAQTPLGTKSMVNLVGVVQGDRPGIIVLGNHYETKYFEDFAFVGANDAGSTTAWMVEMARALGPHRQGRTVWLCFFDGEEAFRAWSLTDGLYGSRAFVKHLRDTERLKDIDAMINVDMIGDCHLVVKRDRDAPVRLNDTVWNTAYRLGYEAHFSMFADSIQDDHSPFRQAGIEALEIIDFCYGETEFDHDRTWHTANDTLDRVCMESLQVVGDVIYHALPKIDAALE